MDQQRSFDFSFTLIFLFSNWYHAHLSIFWAISMQQSIVMNLLFKVIAWKMSKYKNWNRKMNNYLNKRGPLSLSITLILLFPTWYHAHLPTFWAISHVAVMYCDAATIQGVFHERWEWNFIGNRKMSQICNETGTFSLRFTLIFLFSNWYHRHHPRYWSSPT